jgi:hypothetical protein
MAIGPTRKYPKRSNLTSFAGAVVRFTDIRGDGVTESGVSPERDEFT